MENNNINTTGTEQVVWQTNTDATKKKQKLRVFYLVLAVLLTVSSALGSFYLSQNLNQASTPNAPASEPQAAPKKTPIKSWNGGDNCQQGCGSNEYCENGRCRKSGGSGDARDPYEVLVGLGTQPVTAPTKAPLGEYVCTPQNCPAPDFQCKNANTCINTSNSNLSVANDPMNCGGTTTKNYDGVCSDGETCIMGKCENVSTYTCSTANCNAPYVCKEDINGYDHCVHGNITVSPTAYVVIVGNSIPTPTLTSDNDPKNCGGAGRVCSPTQTCAGGICTTSVPGTIACKNLRPDNTDGAGSSRECCVKNLGIIPTLAVLENGSPVPESDIGKVDYRWHWTNCAQGTTCRQGVGCIGTPPKTPDKTTNEVTTTTTINPTKIPTGTVSPTITTTVTIPPTVTATPTGTVTVTGTVTATPTIALCNESCAEDDDCSDGLFCDSESNKCRKPECSDEKDCSCPQATPEPTIVDCNYKCKTDDNCSSGLICDSDSGRCRKAACSDEKDCSCPKPRKTDAPTREVTRTSTRTATQPTVLKEAGILDFPGAAVFGSGLLLTVIGILLAL